MLQEECAHFRKIAQFYQSNSPWILAVNIGRDKKMFNGFEINMQDLLLSTASSQEFFSYVGPMEPMKNTS